MLIVKKEAKGLHLKVEGVRQRSFLMNQFTVITIFADKECDSCHEQEKLSGKELASEVLELCNDRNDECSESIFDGKVSVSRLVPTERYEGSIKLEGELSFCRLGLAILTI